MPTVLATFGDTLADIWRDVIGTQQAPEPLAVIATAALALALVVLPRAWRISRNVVTITHEGAHAAAAVLTGRRLMGVRLHSDTSGLATSRGRPRGPGMILTAAAGYPGPALLGLGAAFLLYHGHALALLWASVVLLALLLLQIRNLYGLLALLVVGGGVFAVSWWGGDTLQSLAAYTGTWFLLLAAPRPVVELQRHRRQGRAPKSDADLLAHLTPLPALLWVGLFLAINVGALVAGGRWLLA